MFGDLWGTETHQAWGSLLPSVPAVSLSTRILEASTGPGVSIQELHSLIAHPLLPAGRLGLSRKPPFPASENLLGLGKAISIIVLS